MSSTMRALLSAGFLGILVVLGVTDYVVTKNKFVLPNTVIASGSTSSAASSGAGQEPQQGPDINAAIIATGLTSTSTQEESVLREIIPSDRTVETTVILQNGDRIAFFAWTQSPDVKTYFSALKGALQASFSPEMHDLVDQTDEPEGKPTRNVLAFSDPAIHEEKLIFIRVRQRLMEFHVAPGKDGQVNALIEALTE